MIKHTFFMLLTLFVIGGCSNQKEADKSKLALMKTTNPAPIEISYQDKDKSIAYQVREDIKAIDEIYDAAVIEGNKKVIVSYKVKHLQRFKMKKIEKELTKQLNKKYPDDTFIVSSDYKIFLEAIRLKEALDDGNISDKEAKKRFNKIIKLKKEMT